MDEQSDYSDLLKPPFQELGQLLRSYKTTPNTHDKVEILLTLIVPLLDTSNELKPLRSSWTKNKKIHLYYKLQKIVLEDLKKLSLHLKKKPSDDKWHKHVALIEASILINPIEAFQEFKNLCELLLEAGRHDLISNYVEFRNIERYQLDEEAQEAKIHETLIIDSYKENLAIYKLCELTRSHKSDPITALDFLYFGRHLWNDITYSAIILDHKNYTWGKHTLPQIFFNSAVEEMKLIKEGRYYDKTSPFLFFSKNKLDAAADLITKCVLRYLKFGQTEPIIPDKPDSLTIRPYENLILLIECRGPQITIYIAKKFNDPSNNGQYKDTETLFNAPEGTFIELGNEASGSNGAKFLERTLGKPLGNLFLMTKTDNVAIKCKTITCNDIPNDDWPEIHEQIERMEKRTP